MKLSLSGTPNFCNPSLRPHVLSVPRAFNKIFNTQRALFTEDFEWAVRLNRFSLEFIGLWPRQARNTRDKLMCNLRTLFVFMTIAFVIVIPAIHSMIRIYGDIMLMIDNLQYTLPISTCLLRILIFWRKKEDQLLSIIFLLYVSRTFVALIPLVGMMASDWKRPKTSRQTTKMIRRAQTARIIISCGYAIMLTGFTIVVIIPVFGISMRYTTNVTDPGRPLPLQTHYMYDVTRSPQFELTFVAQVFTMLLCIMPYTGIDNFLSLMIFHISGQLNILANRLADLGRVDDFHNALKGCVMDHVRLLRAIAVLEETFNIMLLMLFLYFGTLFAFYGFLIISLLQNGDYLVVSDLAYLLTIVINTFGHMCVYCAVGDILAAQCDRIHHEVYCNKWYRVDAKYTRDIVLLMVKSGKPLYLTAGKLFFLTMATFCNLLKTSAGYISILLATGTN